VKINDWVIDIRNGYVFKIEKDWGKYVLHDDYIDSGDVSLKSECRLATKQEIENELKRRGF
jgi:hypothetical protein